VIELKRDAIAQVLLNKLYKLTPMQISYGVINLSIVNGQPRVLSLVDTLGEFVSFRREVVRNRTLYDLRKAKARPISSKDCSKRSMFSTRLSSSFEPRRQPTMRSRDCKPSWLLRASGAGHPRYAAPSAGSARAQKLLDEYKQLLQLIAELEEILNNDRVLRSLIVKNCGQSQKDYADPRRTQIVDSGIELTLEDLIADEDVAITLTHSGYVKRTPVSTYRAQRRGGSDAKA
jgi:DNA gyrase subunit A